MDYISEKEFRNQSEKVQKVLLDWWKPNIGDLIYNFKFNTIHFLNEDYNSNSQIHKEYLLKFAIPLLTEGQLRKFIEDKTDTKV